MVRRLWCVISQALLSFIIEETTPSGMVRALEDIITPKLILKVLYVPAKELEVWQNKSKTKLWQFPLIFQIEILDFFWLSCFVKQRRRQKCACFNTSALWGYFTIRKMQIVLLLQICIAADEVNQQKRFKKFTLHLRRTFSDGCYTWPLTF